MFSAYVLHLHVNIDMFGFFNVQGSYVYEFMTNINEMVLHQTKFNIKHFAPLHVE